LVSQLGDKNNNWKGGRTKNADGYSLVFNEAYVNGYGRHQVKEHRLVFERYYNCCLLPWTDIHHINGIKDDNRLENLEPVLHGIHSKITAILSHMLGKLNIPRDPNTGRFIRTKY
jgi:HNH endonuclease